MSYLRRGIVVWLGIASFVAAGAAMGKVAVVTMKDGRVLKGELIRQDDKSVELAISGIHTPIKRRDIARVQTEPSMEEQYWRRRAELEDDDLDGRYQLAYFLYEQKALLLAREELADLKQRFADNAKVEALSDVVADAIRRRDEQPANSGRPRNERPRLDETPARHLSAEQINLIRLWELPIDILEAKPRVLVPRDVVDKLFERYATHERVPKGRRDQRAFRAAPDYEKLELIFAIQARDLYGQVKVREDPPPLRDFRGLINPIYVARYFRRYFGTGQIEGLTLLGRRPNSHEEAYTNFYLLSQFSASELPMIDRHQPERSLLLQWGLPRDSAVHPAPQVKGWRPYFSSLDDPNLERYVQWISSLYSPTPDYGIDFKLPSAGGDEAASDWSPKRPPAGQS